MRFKPPVLAPVPTWTRSSRLGGGAGAEGGFPGHSQAAAAWLVPQQYQLPRSPASKEDAPLGVGAATVLGNKAKQPPLPR